MCLYHLIAWFKTTHSGAWQALFDFGLVIMAGIQIYWMTRTIGQMRIDADSRDKSDKIKLRARINIHLSPDDIEITKGIYGTINVRINPTITNPGGSASEYMRFAATHSTQQVTNVSIPDPNMYVKAFKENGRNISMEFGTDAFPTSLGNGDTYQVKGDQTPYVLSELAERNKEGNIWIKHYGGFIKYQDVFSDVWIRTFVFQFVLKEDFSGASKVWLRLYNEREDKEWPKNDTA